MKRRRMRRERKGEMGRWERRETEAGRRRRKEGERKDTQRKIFLTCPLEVLLGQTK